MAECLNTIADTCYIDANKTTRGCGFSSKNVKKGVVMKCPFCQHAESSVVDSRLTSEEESIRRRRECSKCKQRFTTYERAEDYEITVIKRDGTSQPFSREKILKGLLLACEKRPVKQEQIETVAARVESSLRRTNKDEVKSGKIGQLVMAELAQLDDVAYVRFTSVHKKFKDAQQFVDAIKTLRKLEKLPEDSREIAGNF